EEGEYGQDTTRETHRAPFQVAERRTPPDAGCDYNRFLMKVNAKADDFFTTSSGCGSRSKLPAVGQRGSASDGARRDRLTAKRRRRPPARRGRGVGASAKRRHDIRRPSY